MRIASDPMTICARLILKSVGSTSAALSRSCANSRGLMATTRWRPLASPNRALLQSNRSPRLRDKAVAGHLQRWHNPAMALPEDVDSEKLAEVALALLSLTA